MLGIRDGFPADPGGQLPLFQPGERRRQGDRTVIDDGAPDQDGGFHRLRAEAGAEENAEAVFGRARRAGQRHKAGHHADKRVGAEQIESAVTHAERAGNAERHEKIGRHLQKRQKKGNDQERRVSGQPPVIVMEGGQQFADAFLLFFNVPDQAQLAAETAESVRDLHRERLIQRGEKQDADHGELCDKADDT